MKLTGALTCQGGVSQVIQTKQKNLGFYLDELGCQLQWKMVRRWRCSCVNVMSDSDDRLSVVGLHICQSPLMQRCTKLGSSLGDDRTERGEIARTLGTPIDPREQA